MGYIETKSIGKFSQFAPIMAKVSFAIYLVFIFFGITPGFLLDISTVEDMQTSNPVNQLILSCLYVLSFLGMAGKKDRVIRLVKTEKFFCLFLLWSFLTIFWSDFPIISFKRWIQYFGTVFISLSALVNFQSVEEAMVYLKRLLIIYVPLTMLSIILGLGASSEVLPGWQGLTSQKNTLGQISLVSLIIWSISVSIDSTKKRALSIMFWTLSLILLVGSRSVTSILTGIVLGGLAITFYSEKIIFRPLMGRFISFIFIALFFLCLASIILIDSYLIVSLLNAFGKDVTLTGRIDLWSAIFEQTRTHLFKGCGFGAFWVPKTPGTDILYEQFTWLPNRAHLGYLDILNETGVIGLSLFGLMIINYFRNLIKMDKTYFWKWFFIAALILNISESTLIIQNSVTGVLFTFSYFALFETIFRLNESPQNSPI
jgi:exopolysaccharide production protein ExoQ